jgi:hypothetical protein
MNRFQVETRKRHERKAYDKAGQALAEVRGSLT